MSQGKNPFGNPDESSPLSSASSKKQLYSADYNPFAVEPVNQASSNAVSKVRPPSPPRQSILSTPALASSAALPPYEPPLLPLPKPAVPAVSSASDDFVLRQQELDRKAAELIAREKQLKDKQLANPRANNWPPLPKCCPKPCFYQNFEMDIMVPYRLTVKCSYYLWIAYSVTLVLNVLFCMAYFISASEATDGIGSTAGIAFGFSLLWLAAFVPLAFVCWYRPVYNAFRSNSSMNFFLFFAMFFLQIITCFVMTLGVGSTGFAGWISAFTMLGQQGSQKVVGGAMTIMAFIFTLNTVGCIALFIKVVRIYRSTGASFEQAQKDFAEGVRKNQAAAAAGTASAQLPTAPARPSVWPPPNTA